MAIWCEFCRIHFEVDHFGHDGTHLAGVEYGPTGTSMWQLQEARRLALDPTEPEDWRTSLLAILNAGEDS